MKRFPLFNSLRAIAALTIVAYHVAFTLGMLGGRTLSPWLAQLNVGVPIFFLISGFLLYRPFAQARFERTDMPAVGAYAIRRALRIVPAYWLALTVIALWLGLHNVFTWGGLGTYYGFFQVYRFSTVTGGIGQAWTIDVELTFYALLPLCALLVRRIPFRSVAGFAWSEGALLATMFVGGLVTKLIAIHNTPPHPSSLSPALYVLPAFLDQFAIGMGLAVASVLLTNSDAGFVRLIDRRPWLPWAVAGVAFYLVGTHIGPLGGDFGERLMAQHYLKAIVALGLLIPAVFGEARRGLVRKLLGWGPLLWVGLVSYGVYLWHRAFITKLYDAGVHNSIGLAASALACTLLAAAASWYGLERYALKLGHRMPRTHQEAALELEPAP